MVKRQTRMIVLRAIIAGLSSAQHSKEDADADQAILRYIAPYLFILEFDRGIPVYHLAGDALRSSLGFDPNGKCFYVNWNADTHASLDKFFRTSLEGKRSFFVLSKGHRRALGPVNFESI